MIPAHIARALTPLATRAPTALTLAFLPLATATVPPPLAAQSGAFGHAVVIDGDEILIAEPTTSVPAGRRVRVHRESGGTWREASMLLAPGFRSARTASARCWPGPATRCSSASGAAHCTFSSAVIGGAWIGRGQRSTTRRSPDSPRNAASTDYCGTDFGLSLAADGDWLLVGCSRHRNAGPPRPSEASRRKPRPKAPSTPTSGTAAGRLGAARQKLQPGDGRERRRVRVTAIVMTHPRRADRRTPVECPHQRSRGPGSRRAACITTALAAGGLGRGRRPRRGAPRPTRTTGRPSRPPSDRMLVGAPGTDDSRGAVYTHSWSADLTRWVPGDGRLTFAERRERRPLRRGRGRGRKRRVGRRAHHARLRDRLRLRVRRPAADGSLPTAPRRIQLPQRGNGRERPLRRAGRRGRRGRGRRRARHAPPGGFGARLRHAVGTAGTMAGMLVSAPDAMGAMVGEERRCTDGQVGPLRLRRGRTARVHPGLAAEGRRAARAACAPTTTGAGPTPRRDGSMRWWDATTARRSSTSPTRPTPCWWATCPRPPTPRRRSSGGTSRRTETTPSSWPTGRESTACRSSTSRGFADISPDGHARALRARRASTPRVASSHNIVINEETGFAYAVGSRGRRRGVRRRSAHDRHPGSEESPGSSGCGSSDGIHDSQCVVYDGPDERYHGPRTLPELERAASSRSPTCHGQGQPGRGVERPPRPNPAYIHQGWLTPDQRYFFQDDEADVISGQRRDHAHADLGPQRYRRPRPHQGVHGIAIPASAHNLYIKDGFMYQANYLYGLHVLDISDPENPREVAAFDTAPYKEGPGFGGAWSNYPYFESGTVIVTSMQEGLFVLKKRVRPVS